MNTKSPFEVYPAVFQVIAPSVMLLLGLIIAVLMDAYLNRKQRQVMITVIDRHGANVTRREAFATLYEDRMYDRPMQKQFDVIIRALRSTLMEHGVGEIFQMESAAMRVKSELISCDAWSFFEGDPDAIHAFFGEYMNNYSWAVFTESSMRERKAGKP